MTENNPEFQRGFKKGCMVILAGAIPYTLVTLANTLLQNYIPNESKVQEGFAIPSKLEIKLQDLDNNGEREVLMAYNGQNYLLRLDEQGKPIVQGYEVTPSRILIK